MIYPKIVLKEFLEDIDSVAVKPWVKGHVLCLVDDVEGIHSYLQRPDVGAAWDRLYAEALANLRDLCNAESETNAVPGADGIEALVFEGHNHVAATPLLKSFDKACQQHLGQGYLFSIPAIDELAAYREASWKKYAKIAYKTFKTASHPVSPHVFTSEDGGYRIRFKVKFSLEKSAADETADEGEDVPEEEREHCRKLIEIAGLAAENLLKGRGGFPPFAIVMSPDLETQTVALAGRDYESSSSFVQLLAALRRQAEKGAIIAAALVTVCRVQPPESSKQVSALRVDVESRHGPRISAFRTYKKTGATYKFLQHFGQQGPRAIFLHR